MHLGAEFEAGTRAGVADKWREAVPSVRGNGSWRAEVLQTVEVGARGRPKATGRYRMRKEGRKIRERKALKVKTRHL